MTYKTLKLPSELRSILKRPIGRLLRGSPLQNASKLKKIISREEPTAVIAVGDSTARNLLAAEIPVNLFIIDCKIMRKPVEPFTLKNAVTIQAKNPPGMITAEAWKAIANAVNSTNKVIINVDGEEDLLTLTAILCAPNNAFVVYGQPHKGLVIVKTTSWKKRQVARIINLMTSQ
ncbi:DUF359 domain-containing protein [Candidatus Bathyarchaeota archaeon]|nr:DUF359 domain-containing protein [Candidatus Bathyarchaeota archaeon]